MHSYLLTKCKSNKYSNNVITNTPQDGVKTIPTTNQKVKFHLNINTNSR